MTTTHFTIEHLVVPSNQPYDQVIQALEAQLGQGNELEAIFQHVYETHRLPVPGRVRGCKLAGVLPVATALH